MDFKKETLYKTTDGTIKGNFFIKSIRNGNRYEIFQKGSYFNIHIDDSSVIKLTAPRFRIGETVRVKTKREFEKDFTILNDQPWGFRVITCSNFQQDMNEFCGKEYEISHKTSDGTFRLVNGMGFYFDSDMLVKLHNIIYKEV